MNIFVGTVSVFFAALFAGSTLHKARDFQAFQDVVRGYGLIPGWGVKLSAPLIVLSEAVSVLLLLMSPWVGGAGLIVAAGLLTAYAAAIAANFLRGRTDIDCGCGWGGPVRDEGKLTVWHVLRTASLAGAAAMAALVSTLNGADLMVGDLALGVMCAAPFFVIYVGADALIDNWAKLTRESA